MTRISLQLPESHMAVELNRRTHILHQKVQECRLLCPLSTTSKEELLLRLNSFTHLTKARFSSSRQVHMEMMDWRHKWEA